MGNKTTIQCDRCDSIMDENKKFNKLAIANFAVNDIGESDIPDYTVIKYMCGECYQEVVSEVLRRKRIHL